MKNEIKKALKKVPYFQKSVRFVRERTVDISAISSFLMERRIPRENTPIRVGFFCQYIPAWSKVEDLYNAMRKDPDFETYIICVPSGIKHNRLIDPANLENDAYEYCMRKGYTAVNALTGRDNWLDLEQMQLEYVFYPRPYNDFMPSCYKTGVVSRFSKICLIMYGIEISEDTTNIALNRNFMSNVYLYFSDFKSMMEKNIKNNWLPHRLGMQRTVCTGYPMIEKIFRYHDTRSSSWQFSQNSFRVLWTPRWTTDPYVGGTNFFEYRDAFMEIAAEYPSIDFLFRPHPLMFSHFVEIGKMTEVEVFAFKDRCHAMTNVRIDQQQEYEATFWGSSVLVSDISSIMPEYLATGKPMIFCNTNMKLNLVPHMKRILEGCYIVQNKSELVQCLLMLKDGIDPMKEKRKEIIDELFAGMNEGVNTRIITILKLDHFDKT